MSDLRDFATDYATKVQPPQLHALARVAQQRRRRDLALTAAAAVLAVATLALTLPGGRDLGRAQVPAQVPTTTRTIEGLLASKSLKEIATQGSSDTVIKSDDGTEVRQYVLCLDYRGVPTDNPVSERMCRIAFEVVGRNGARVMVPGSPMGLDSIGDDLFVHPIWGATDVGPYLISADMTAPVWLEEGTNPGGPGPGRHLVPCHVPPKNGPPPPGLALCVADLNRTRLDLMSSAALPSWLGEIRAHGLIDGELIVDLGDGLTYVAYGLAPGEAPALVSPNAAAQRLAVLEKEVAPREGMRLVREFSTSPTCVCAIDIETQTLTPVDLPEGVTWAVDTTGGFWGLAEDGWTATWLDTRGEPRTKVLADDPRAVRLAERGAAAAMAYWDLPHYGPDHEAPVTDALLHVSTDRGQTWRVLRVPATVTRGDIDSRRLPDGWQNWPVAN